jgi:hypothetical protein
MTIEKLQAKLAKAEAEIKGLQVYKQLMETQAEGSRMFMSCIRQYTCKICMLIHFPEPLTECPTEADNKEQLEREKRVRERYFNEFEAVVKRCTDEHGKVQWDYVDKGFREDQQPVFVTAVGPDTEKRTPWQLTLDWWQNKYGDEEENARARCCGREMQHALIAAGRRAPTANKRKWAFEAMGIPAEWLQKEQP